MVIEAGLERAVPLRDNHYMTNAAASPLHVGLDRLELAPSLHTNSETTRNSRASSRAWEAPCSGGCGDCAPPSPPDSVRLPHTLLWHRPAFFCAPVDYAMSYQGWFEKMQLINSATSSFDLIIVGHLTHLFWNPLIILERTLQYWGTPYLVSKDCHALEVSQLLWRCCTGPARYPLPSLGMRGWLSPKFLPVVPYSLDLEGVSIEHI